MNSKAGLLQEDLESIYKTVAYTIPMSGYLPPSS